LAITVTRQFPWGETPMGELALATILLRRHTPGRKIAKTFILGSMRPGRLAAAGPAKKGGKT
jgi:hypothetical protein